MEPATTVRKMMAGNRIYVPSYQRAYSWDSITDSRQVATQTDIFLSDLEEYCKSGSPSPYYFGHFLFEEKSSDFAVIDGQQRLSTIVIFLSVLFSVLRRLRPLSDDEENCFEDMIRRRNEVRFTTVEYDNQLFLDYIINQTKIDHHGLETDSSKRIVACFDYFQNVLQSRKESELVVLLQAISNATCTTHPVKRESDAIQMFIFQNSRGKKPSSLEIVKAQFMYTIHLYGKADTSSLIVEIKNRFEKIYKSISKIEYKIDEDDVLILTQRVHFNSLWEGNALDKIDRELAKADPISFIVDFTRDLTRCFENLSMFFNEHEKENFNIHSLIVLGGISVALPFVLKAYQYGLSVEEIGKISKGFEGMVLRHRIIGTRAEITSRLNDVYAAFSAGNKSLEGILGRIEDLKVGTDWWWAYWNNEKFRDSLQGSINHSIARFLLWKYENHLNSGGKSGYSPIRFDSIESPELEHIAPTTEPTQKNHGYDEYDEEFVNRYLDCLGNHLLLSKSHNASIHNDPIKNKLKDYSYLAQQREVKALVDSSNPKWTRQIIGIRKEKIVEFIVQTF